jgi:hypothetical protein
MRSKALSAVLGRAMWGVVEKPPSPLAIPSALAGFLPRFSFLEPCQGSDQPSSRSAPSASDQARLGSHRLASTSQPPSLPRMSRPSGPKSHTAAMVASQLQQLRSYGYPTPKPRFKLPKPVAKLVEEKIAQQRRLAPEPPPAPRLEQRTLMDTSMRVGCIATKAGMTQEWDEHGVRVPLTVLWVDECQVRALKCTAFSPIPCGGQPCRYSRPAVALPPVAR